MSKKMIIGDKNDFFAQTLSSIGDGVIATDLNGNIILFNKTAEEITGWIQSEAIGKIFQDIFTFIDDDTNKLLKSSINNAFMFNKSIKLEKNSALITKNKGIKYISAKISPIKDDDGVMLGSVTIFSDVTQVRMIERKTKEEQNDFVQLVNLAPIGAIVLDENSVITRINETAIDFLSGSEMLSIGKKFVDVFGCEESITTEQECRHGNECINYDIKKAVHLAIKSGLSTNNIEFSKVIEIKGAKRKLWFKASITPVILENKKNVVIIFTDITDRKKIETEISKSRDYYLGMFEKFPFMIWKTDVSGRNEFVSKKCCDFTGKIREECLEYNWMNSIHPEDMHKFYELHTKSVQEKKSYEIEYRAIDHSGQYRWIQSITRPFYNLEGKFDGLIGTGIDITDRKIAEEWLNRYKILLENVRDIINFMDIEGNIIDVNQSALEAYGYTYEEFLKLNIRDLRAEGTTTSKLIEKCDGEGVFFETTHKRKDGSVFTVEISSKRADIAGERVIVNIIRDITKRKEIEMTIRDSEEKYRNIFNNANDAIFIYEINNNFKNEKFVEVNNVACTHLGYTKEELLNMSVSDINGEKKKEKLEYIREVMQKYGKGIFETCHRTKDNKIIPVEVNVHTFNQNDKRVGLAIVRDITQRKIVEISLKSAKRSAEIANKAKSEFLANMSHEIRTPINGIIGMIDLTITSELNNEQKENLMIAKSCANSLLKIINDILDFSKMEAGKLVIENINFDIKSLIEETAKAHSPSVATKDIELNYAFSSTIPKYVIGDPIRLQQILNNLISNAIKFTERGEVWIKVKRVENKDNNNVEIKFSVEDTGIGISEDKMEMLFQSFSQLDGSITRKFGGTGLGLVISKKLSEMMGGRLWVESKKGIGSKFHFILKFGIGTRVETKPKDNVIQSRNIDRQCNILLAEDDEINRIVITRILRERGYSIDTACNGLEAIDKCKKNSYDVILMDIQMPIMDGIEAAKIIKEGDKNIPIIAITAYALKGDREKFLSQGMDEYVSKPIKTEELYEIIEKSLSLKQHNEDLSRVAVCLDENGEIVLKQKRVPVFNKENSDILKELSNAINHMNNALNKEEFSQVEPLAHKIRELSNEAGIEELKTVAFKIELAARRENFDQLIEKVQKASSIFEVFKKSIL